MHLGSRAIGGAGLVMTEMTDVSREGRISPGCAGMYLPAHVAGWRRIVEFVHRESEAKIGMQLSHAGRKGSTRVLWEGEDEPLPEGNWPLIAPSPIPYRPHNQTPREMTRGDMDQVAADFVRATGMADAAGFDLLELHLAHGYLLASFISPLTNRRTDEYGGSLANRMRYPLEIVTRVRAEWPQAKPLSVRISAVDWAPGGMEAHDAVEVARMVVAAGADIVDVSAGQTVPEAKPVYGRQFQTPFSDRIRHEARVPTMTVGNISSPADVNTILAAGRADLVGPVLDPPCGRRPGLYPALAADVRDAQPVQAATAVVCTLKVPAVRARTLRRLRAQHPLLPVALLLARLSTDRHHGRDHRRHHHQQVDRQREVAQSARMWGRRLVALRADNRTRVLRVTRPVRHSRQRIVTIESMQRGAGHVGGPGQQLGRHR